MSRFACGLGLSAARRVIMPCGTLVTLCCAAGHFVRALTEMRAQAGTRGYSWDRRLRGKGRWASTEPSIAVQVRHRTAHAAAQTDGYADPLPATAESDSGRWPSHRQLPALADANAAYAGRGNASNVFSRSMPADHRGAYSSTMAEGLSLPPERSLRHFRQLDSQRSLEY